MTRYFPQDIFTLITQASNILTSENSSYTKDDFLTIFPQFTDKVSDDVFTLFINLANSHLNEERWGGSWNYGMALFIAHFITLYIKASGTTDAPVSDPVKSGLTKGIVSSKSVDGVSVSYDVSQIFGSMTGWASYRTTEYGIQLISIAKLIGKGGMYVI